MLAIEKKVRAAGFFELGDVLPNPFSKGIQPEYLDQPTDDSVPVINTLSIQNLAIREADCRHISGGPHSLDRNPGELRETPASSTSPHPCEGATKL